MRGFIVTLEALLAFLLLISLLASLFLPAPNTLGVADFLVKNDEITAFMEICFPDPSSCLPGSGTECTNIRYYFDRFGVLQEVCIR